MSGVYVDIASCNTNGARLKLTGKQTFSIAQSEMESGNRERMDCVIFVSAPPKGSKAVSNHID